MPRRKHTPAHLIATCCLGAALAGAGIPVAAAGAPEQPAPPAGAVASSRAASAPPRSSKGPQDPMEFLRERLAAKFGNDASLDATKPGMIRVVNHSPAAAPVAPRAAASTTTSPSPAKAVAPARPPHAAADPHRWDYQGAAGPDHWAALSADFAACARGNRQSPIDIRDGIAVELDPIAFDYHPSPFRVTDNGHTVQVDVEPGNAIDVLGRRYELQQFHFHNPSEERIDGRRFAMVVHLVHKSADGRLAVVAVLLEPGSANAVVQSVWNNLPLEKGEPVRARKSLDLAALLPAERGYYTYMGSLTTPPCSEGVLWMVMRQPVQLSAEQIAIFARLYPMNARPLQQAAGRLIKQSN